MPTLRIYDIFISHAWTYGADYYRLVEMLDSARYFQWRNFSISEDDPLHGGTAAQLRAGLARQLRRVHVTLVLAGVYASHSDWIQEELDLAEMYDKPVIGIYPWGSQRASAAVQDAAVTMVGWNTNSIVNAIREFAL